MIESYKGNISLTLPHHFSGDVDLWSVQGKAKTDFLVEKESNPTTFGPEPANHLIGRVKDGGELLRIYSELGNIEILKGQ